MNDTDQFLSFVDPPLIDDRPRPEVTKAAKRFIRRYGHEALDRFLRDAVEGRTCSHTMRWMGVSHETVSRLRRRLGDKEEVYVIDEVIERVLREKE